MNRRAFLLGSASIAGAAVLPMPRVAAIDVLAELGLDWEAVYEEQRQAVYSSARAHLSAIWEAEKASKQIQATFAAYIDPVRDSPPDDE